MSSFETTTCLLASKADIKIKAVKCVFDKLSSDLKLDTFDCSELNLPPQPINEAGMKCAKVRLNHAKESIFPREYDYYVSIENSISNGEDVCNVIIEHKGIVVSAVSKYKFSVPEPILDVLGSAHKHPFGGYMTTAGELIRSLHPKVDPKNWMKLLHGVCRSVQISSGIHDALEKLKDIRKECLEFINKYNKYPDYPKTGVLFWDIFSVIRDPSDIQRLMRLLKDNYQFDEIDYVVGPESRGFFGFGLSVAAGYGFIPIRKKGKLPGNVKCVDYGTEYSKDALEIQTDHIKPGSKVLVFDDLIATGGSLRAACDLLVQVGCRIVDCVVLIENKEMKNEAKQHLGRPYRVLFQQ